MSHRNLYNRVRDAHRGSIVIRAQHKVLSQTNGTGAQVQLVVARLRALVQCLHHSFNQRHQACQVTTMGTHTASPLDVSSYVAASAPLGVVLDRFFSMLRATCSERKVEYDRLRLPPYTDQFLNVIAHEFLMIGPELLAKPL